MRFEKHVIENIITNKLGIKSDVEIDGTVFF